MIVGEITSSNRYNNLKDGKAIAININAGVSVHTSSKNVFFKPTARLFKSVVTSTTLAEFLTNRKFAD